MWLYALSIFVSAFLLFQVQPVIAKLILPWFGGSASVWITCLLFFQVVLLLGYAYGHWLISRVRPKWQKWTHLVLLAASILALPVIPGDTWRPTGWEDPTLRILGLLAATLGLPYLLLSATSPILQAWYAAVGKTEQRSPYRLFAFSNAGSMLGLLSYPVAVEPFVSVRHQALGWSAAYVALAALLVWVAFLPGKEVRDSEFGIRDFGKETKPEPRNPIPASPFPPFPVSPFPPPDPELPPRNPDQKPQTQQRGLRYVWVALAACASVLLLAITNHMTQNVAAVPLLWVVPLSLYLLSFILCFGSKRAYRRSVFLRLLAVALAGMAWLLSPQFLNARLIILIPAFSAGLFVCCMVCHGELARLKPHPSHLTSFYLMVSLGGALGGVFVSLLSPHLFRGAFELQVGMASCAVLTLLVLHRDPHSVFYRTRWEPRWLLVLALLVALVANLAFGIHQEISQARVMVRNFYGTLRVIDLQPPKIVLIQGGSIQMLEPEPGERKLMHGTIDHGLQFLGDLDRRRQPTSYYGLDSGVGLALHEAGERGPLRVGVIGLGPGTLATYGRPGDHYTFYEINPLVIQLAKTEFSFLSDCQAEINIVQGDARLTLERQPVQGFDLLAVDAFSGDAIPVHLLTREAFAIYFRHLKPDGVVAVNVSNRYVNLQPVVRRAAESLGKQAVAIVNAEDEQRAISRATWVLVAGRGAFFDRDFIDQASTPPRPIAGLRVWTDDYSNLLQVLRLPSPPLFSR
jgi:SAM-dependent methyltransferase